MLDYVFTVKNSNEINYLFSADNLFVYFDELPIAKEKASVKIIDNSSNTCYNGEFVHNGNSVFVNGKLLCDTAECPVWVGGKDVMGLLYETKI
jgi:hypothetical protein